MKTQPRHTVPLLIAIPWMIMPREKNMLKVPSNTLRLQTSMATGLTGRASNRND